MFVTSALTVFCVLLCRGGMGIGSMLIVSAAGALAASAVELVTPDGMDTITCPSAAMAVILPLTAILGGLA